MCPESGNFREDSSGRVDVTGRRRVDGEVVGREVVARHRVPDAKGGEPDGVVGTVAERRRVVGEPEAEPVGPGGEIGREAEADLQGDLGAGLPAAGGGGRGL